MDFTKLQSQVAALIAPVREQQQKAQETRRMTAAEFAEYADEQVKKAQKESDAGRRDLSKRRLVALQSEVQRLAKFEFKPSELPSVTVYKDPDQLDTTETEQTIQGLGNSEVSGNHWTAKANSLAKHLAEAIGELSNRPTDKNEGGSQQPAPGQPPQQPGQQQPGQAPGEQQTPAGDPPAPAPEKKEAQADEWPLDMAKCLHKRPRDTDSDYDWGRDAP